MRYLLILLLLASPLHAQWANISTNALGVKYDVSVARPSDGNAITYSAAAKAWAASGYSVPIGGAANQVLHGGTPPTFSKLVVSDINSGAAGSGNVPTADGAGGVNWMAQTGGGGSGGGSIGTASNGSSTFTTASNIRINQSTNITIVGSVSGGIFDVTVSGPAFGTVAGTSLQGGTAAGGDLTGTLPSPTIAALAVTDAKVAAANKDGLAAVPSMRKIGRAHV